MLFSYAFLIVTRVLVYQTVIRDEHDEAAHSQRCGCFPCLLRWVSTKVQGTRSSSRSDSSMIVIRIFEDHAPGPNSSSLDIVKALRSTIRDYSNQYRKELGRCLHQGRGTGFTACINRLGIALKLSAAEA